VTGAPDIDIGKEARLSGDGTILLDIRASYKEGLGGTLSGSASASTTVERRGVSRLDYCVLLKLSDERTRPGCHACPVDAYEYKRIPSRWTLRVARS
jgi:hypothetical protein